MMDSTKAKSLPRGIRNNNPLNIRKGCSWKGETQVSGDAAFETYVSMQYGIRAAFVLFRNYISGWNGKAKPLNTIRKIVTRWAPPSENATARYINVVSKRTGILPDEPLKFRDRRKMIDIARAMAWVECGQEIDTSIFESAYDLL